MRKDCTPRLRHRPPANQLLDIEDGGREQSLDEHLLAAPEVGAFEAVLYLGVSDDGFNDHLAAAKVSTSAARAQV